MEESLPTTATPLKPGEQIEVTVSEDASFNGVHTIRKEGHIIFPTYGRLSLAGLTPVQAEVRIRELLQSGKLRVATVILDRIHQIDPAVVQNETKALVYLSGRVVQPGQHVLTFEKGKPLGVYEAMMVTGGFARFADARKAYIIRSTPGSMTKRRLALNLELVAQGREPDMPVHPGDVIVVPEKVFGF
jgi:protein involved in polysaccharide export with SLBB domain